MGKKPTQDQIHQYCIGDGEGSHETPPVSEDLLTPNSCWDRDALFFSCVATDKLPSLRNNFLPMLVQASMIKPSSTYT